MATSDKGATLRANARGSRNHLRNAGNRKAMDVIYKGSRHQYFTDGRHSIQSVGGFLHREAVE